MNLSSRIENAEVHASVPCRVDFGGTLDISSIYLPLIWKKPSTFNIAINMRTHAKLMPWKEGQVKISSRGFDSAVFEHDKAPFNHPMGLMFAVAKYFNVHGIHIRIESESPPRSALGGSSSAAMAIISAIHHAMGKKIDPVEVAWLAHYIEAAVAGVPCGLQDQLAAAFGGVNQWKWQMGRTSPEFVREKLCRPGEETVRLESSMAVAYCGIPHVSKDINGRWIKSFLSGETRAIFEAVSDLTNNFCQAVKEGNFRQAADFMNQETRLRCEMTPDVLDITGKKLFEKAIESNCGARFTGAGGGGCLWAVGEKSDIETLIPLWKNILSPVEGAKILDAKIENRGIVIH